MIALALAPVLAITHFSRTAAAGNYEFENGVEARWGLDTSIGTSLRTRDADPYVIGRQNGGQAPSSSTDDGNLNFRKAGDVYSSVAKAIGELKLQKDGFGVFVRGKGWYDYTQSQKKVPFGSVATNYQAGKALDDRYFDSLSKFGGLALLDAYAFGEFQPSDDTSVSFKGGRHAVNWGESLFIGGGINQYNPIDAAAARRPGAQIKEVILPSTQLSASFGFAGMSLEGFYKIKNDRTVLDGCGTFWSPSDGLNCRDPEYGFSNLTSNVSDRDALARYKLTGTNQYPKDGGSYGLSLRRLIGDVDVGAYFVNYTITSPRISLVNTPSTAGGFFQSTVPFQGFWDWSANDIKVYGLSGATEMFGWSVSGEVSRTRDYPVQINGADLVGGYGVQNGGILGQTKGGAFRSMVPAGGIFRGYDLKDKTQIQLSTLKSFSNVLGADSLSLAGEVAYQHWSGIGDPYTSTRYGRDFSFGIASWAANGTSSTCVPTGTKASQAGCKPDGYATSNAWGYRLQASLLYPDVIGGVNLTPRIFWSHDVDGYSADGVFLKDRMVLGLGLRAEYLKKYYADISYSHYNPNATYDPFRDRDFVSVVAGMTF